MMKYAINAYGIATGGGTLAYQALAPTAAKADKMVDERLATAITADANDFIYQWEASHDYNPAPALEKIEATLLLINAADDERNPPETGVTDAALKRVKNGRLFLIPASQRDARPSHDRQREVLQEAAAGTAADRAAAGDVDRRSECAMSASRFRRAALALPGAIEGAHQRTADFRVGKRIFATLGYPDDDWGMVKLTPEQQSVLVDAEPEIFRPVPGGWGKQRLHQCAAGKGRCDDAEERARHGVEECRAENDGEIGEENEALISHRINSLPPHRSLFERASARRLRLELSPNYEFAGGMPAGTRQQRRIGCEGLRHSSCSPACRCWPARRSPSTAASSTTCRPTSAPGSRA